MKRIFLFLILGVFLISFTPATLSIPTAEQCQSVELIQFCPSCTFVNLSSITFPDNSIQYFNTDMTKNGSTFNFSFSDTCQIGDYVYFVEGDKDGTLAGESLPMIVTSTGLAPGSILNNSLIIFLLVISTLLLVAGAKLEFPSLGFVGAITLTLTGVYTMIYGLNDIVNLYTRTIAVVEIGIGLVFMFISAYEWGSWGK